MGNNPSELTLENGKGSNSLNDEEQKTPPTKMCENAAYENSTEKESSHDNMEMTATDAEQLPENSEHEHNSTVSEETNTQSNTTNESATASELSPTGEEMIEEFKQVKPRRTSPRKSGLRKLHIDPMGDEENMKLAEASPSGRPLGSARSLKSADRPASACINWDEIDWESLGADSDPFNISPNSLVNKKKRESSEPETNLKLAAQSAGEPSNSDPKTAVTAETNSVPPQPAEPPREEFETSELEEKTTSHLTKVFTESASSETILPLNTSQTEHPTNDGPSFDTTIPQAERNLRKPLVKRLEIEEENNASQEPDHPPMATSPSKSPGIELRRQLSEDRPASARVDWEKINWDALDPSTNPFTLSNDVLKSNSTEQSSNKSEDATLEPEHGNLSTKAPSPSPTAECLADATIVNHEKMSEVSNGLAEEKGTTSEVDPNISDVATNEANSKPIAEDDQPIESEHSTQRQLSTDRPASARVDWEKINWDALDASSDPFSLSGTVINSEPSKQMEQSMAESPNDNLGNKKADAELTQILTPPKAEEEATEIGTTEIPEHFNSEQERDTDHGNISADANTLETDTTMGSEHIAKSVRSSEDPNPMQRQSSTDRPASARVDWEKIDWDALDESSNPFHLHDAVTKAEPTKKIEHSGEEPRAIGTDGTKSDTPGNQQITLAVTQNVDSSTDNRSEMVQKNHELPENRPAESIERDKVLKVDSGDVKENKIDVDSNSLLETAPPDDRGDATTQAVKSPPLPRGEYKIDWDNLDEFSDPFGGKVVPKVAKQKADAVQEEEKSQSRPSKADHTTEATDKKPASKTTAKPTNTDEPNSQIPPEESADNSQNTDKATEQQPEVTPPIPRGEYKIDWSNIDEFSDPFGGKVTNSVPKRTKTVTERHEQKDQDGEDRKAKVDKLPNKKSVAKAWGKPKESKKPVDQAQVKQEIKADTMEPGLSDSQPDPSPIIPRGEYKLDFDNLDEFSDPFGGKVTKATFNHSTPKPGDSDGVEQKHKEEPVVKPTKSKPVSRTNEKSRRTAKPSNLAKPKETTDEPSEEQMKATTMDDRPLKSGGAYNIDWDALDEATDPFDKIPSTTPQKPPVKVDSKGDGPVEPTDPAVRSPAKSGFKPATPVRTSSVPKTQTCVPSSDQPPSIPNGTGPEIEGTGNPTVYNGFSSHNDENVPPQPTPNSAPTPEQLAQALEQAALSENTAPSNPEWPDETPSSQPADPLHTQPLPDESTVHPNQVLTKIDSSTRPASPAQPLLQRPSMDDELGNSTRFDTPVTENEVIALRKERDELVKTIDEMHRCLAEYDRSLQHMIAEKSQGQAQINVSIADLISERDQAVEEVATIEKAFGDLHRRFEKSKQVIEGFKQNEEALKRSIEEYKTLLQRQETKYLALKKHAEEKLLKITQDTESAKQEAESNATRLQASLRMMEVQVKGLEAQLEQKKRENAELTKICEELLSKYSGGAT